MTISPWNSQLVTNQAYICFFVSVWFWSWLWFDLGLGLECAWGLGFGFRSGFEVWGLDLSLDSGLGLGWVLVCVAQLLLRFLKLDIIWVLIVSPHDLDLLNPDLETLRF